MSAFIVSRRHIALLDGALAYYDVTNSLPSDAQLLWDENIKSVQFRYNGDSVKDLPGPIDEDFIFKDYTYTREDLDLIKNPFKMAMLVHCYNYQSCEHPEWAYSYVRNLMQKLEEKLVEKTGLKHQEFLRQAMLTDVWSI